MRLADGGCCQLAAEKKGHPSTDGKKGHPSMRAADAKGKKNLAKNSKNEVRCDRGRVFVGYINNQKGRLAVALDPFFA